MPRLRQKSIGIILLTICALSGCTGGCWKEIDIYKVSDPTTITNTIHNITRTDITQLPWLITELDNLVNNITSSKTWDISDDNYTALRDVFISLNIIRNSTANSGKGSAVESSYNYLMRLYLRFELVIVELTVVNWCGS